MLISIQSLIFCSEPYFNEPGYESALGTLHGKTISSLICDDSHESVDIGFVWCKKIWARAIFFCKISFVAVSAFLANTIFPVLSLQKNDNLIELSSAERFASYEDKTFCFCSGAAKSKKYNEIVFKDSLNFAILGQVRVSRGNGALIK